MSIPGNSQTSARVVRCAFSANDLGHSARDSGLTGRVLVTTGRPESIPVTRTEVILQADAHEALIRYGPTSVR